MLCATVPYRDALLARLTRCRRVLRAAAVKNDIVANHLRMQARTPTAIGSCAISNEDRGC